MTAFAANAFGGGKDRVSVRRVSMSLMNQRREF
jgi:hypothetical protein